MTFTKTCLFCKAKFVKGPKQNMTSWTNQKFCSKQCQRNDMRGEHLRDTGKTVQREKIEKLLLHNYGEATVRKKGNRKILMKKGKVVDKEWWEKKTEKALKEARSRRTI